MGDGDGTVNRRSMEACLRWGAGAGQQKHPVHHKVFKGVNHAQMIKGDVPNSNVKHLVLSLNNQLNNNDVNDDEDDDVNDDVNHDEDDDENHNDHQDEENDEEEEDLLC